MVLKILGKTKTERRNTGYNFAQVYVRDDFVKKLLSVYYERGTGKYGLEVYQGPNYVPPIDSREKSYSRNYKSFRGMPTKYREIAKKLLSKVPKK